MSSGLPARHRSLSSTSRPTHVQLPPSSKGKTRGVDTYFAPCAATASLLLFSQGPVILCLHHDTLAVERRFTHHAEDVQFISVDNVSERGAGRLVVSYDVGQTAIVWDLFTGGEHARFAAFEPLQVAAWMRNGNVAFGNTKGEVILFEPSTQEHVSARTIFDPITALAPASDCKTYAIGYRNGSILLASLQPAFTILHTLSTSRGPSPIANLAWHASSSKQKSDMLATQTSDGDLRVWSVAKPPTSEAPRIIRVLKRADTFASGPNWMAWSKNGRIVQYSEKETWSWDVRTKHVTYEPVPTVEDVRALASYGPTATLFTLGPNHTVQQYDLEDQQMVANVQHHPTTIPPTPPEENRQLGVPTSESEEEYAEPIQRANYEISALEAARVERTQSASPRSVPSRTDSVSSRTSSLRGRFFEAPSPAQRTDRTGTTFSFGIQSQMSKDPLLTSSSLTYPSSAPSPASTRSARKGSRLRQEILPSPEDEPVKELFPYIRARLSDVPYKPIRPFDESRLTPDDLRRQMLNVVFGWDEDIQNLIRDELSRHPMGSQNAVLLSKWLDDDPDHMAAMIGAGGTPSNLDWMMLALSGLGSQVQTKKIGQAFVEKMLAKGDVHAAATILLSLGDEDDAIEVYVTRHHFMEAILLTCLLRPSDWQRQSFLVRRWGEHVVENAQQHLAIRCFSCTGVEPSEPWTSPTAQRAVNFTEHAAATEELLQAQAQPPWSKQRRGFLDAPTPIAMPAPQPKFGSAPPGARMTTKNSALKLITSFAPPAQSSYKFPGLKSDDRTPTNAPGVTPIAESAVGESALTPGGLGSYRLNSARALSNAYSGRTATPGGYLRQRLPSIGETPVDVSPPTFPEFQAPKPLPTPDNSGSDKEKEADHGTARAEKAEKTAENAPVLILSSARYEPTNTPKKDTPVTAVEPQTTIKFQPAVMLPSPHVSSDGLPGESNSRNGSRTRKPEGLSIQMVPVQETITDDSTTDAVVYAELYRRSETAGSYSTTQIDTHSEMTSPPTTGNSQRSLQTQSPSVSGRSIDQYISSLEQAQYYTKHHRGQPYSSRDRRGKEEHHERKKSKHRQAAPSEEDRGRKNRRVIPSAKRSPSSPVPMSPEDLNMYSASVDSFESVYQAKNDRTTHKSRDISSHSRSTVKVRSDSKTSERRRHRSTSRNAEGKSKTSSRATSRRRSPGPMLDTVSRGRQETRREGSRLRSPSSPVPMAASGEDLRKGSDTDPALRLVSHDRERVQSQRSKSRRPERGTSARRDPSPDRRKPRTRSNSRRPKDQSTGLARKNSLSGRAEVTDRNANTDNSNDRPLEPQWTAGSEQALTVADDPLYSALYEEASSGMKMQSLSDRRKKEIAAAELEARRLSLARRPSAPAIPLPGHLALHAKSLSVGTPPSLLRANTESNLPTLHSNSFMGRMIASQSPTDPTHSDSGSSGKASSKSRKVLPGTPRAMRHPEYSSNADGVPDIPNNLATLTESVYRPEAQLDIRRSMSAPIPDHTDLKSVPVDLPMHPAYDWRLPNSRSNSKTRDRDFSPSGRAPSRDRAHASPREAQTATFTTTAVVTAPPVLPELQHLALPPPPPPPPPPPSMLQNQAVNMASLLAAGTNQGDSGSSTAPLTQAGFPDPPPPPHHRRGRSGNENFVDKIRSITGRLRSTSRGRNTQSPPSAQSDNPSPYESIPIQAFQAMNTAS